MTSKQFNVRLPLHTERQLAEIVAASGLTVTQTIILAVDALHRQVCATSPAPDQEQVPAPANAGLP